MTNWGGLRKSSEEEMSKEAESKRRYPSVFGRLVGRDRLFSLRHINQRGKNLSVNIQESSRYCGRLANSGSSSNQQQFRDVHENLGGAPDISDHRYSSNWNASAMLSKHEMAFIQQSIEAQRLSTDGNLHESMLGSSDDLLLKYVQQPRSFLAKHSHDRNVEPSRSNKITGLNPAESTMYEGNSKAWKSETGTSSKHSSTSQLNHKDCLLPKPQNLHKAQILHKAPGIQQVEKNTEKPRPTRIVVLKPKYDQEMHNVSVHDDIKKSWDDASVRGTKEVLLRREVLSDLSEEAYRIARRVTRKIEGYEGDISSFNGSDCESLSSRKPFGDNKLHKDLCGTLAESSAHKVSNRRLIERWKMNQRYQDLELIAKGVTLGEMLALSDRETTPNELNPKVRRRRAINRTLGISSRDNGKGETASIPPSRGKRSHKRSKSRNKFVEDKYVAHNNPAGHSGSTAMKGNLTHKLPVSPYQHIYIDGMDSKVEADFEIQMEANIKDAREQQLMLQMFADRRKCRSPKCDGVMNAEHGSRISSQSPDYLPEKSPDEETVHDQKDSNLQELHKGSAERNTRLQCIGIERDSSESSKDADYESPVSVLKVPFPADTSSYACFERVSAQLHELKKQLQLITTESGSVDAPAFVSMEEEFSELSPARADDWESVYALDVLICSGLEEPVFDLFKNNWHSQDCPLDPDLFDELEEKYEDEATGSCSERKFLFDRINFALVEIFEEHVDLFPWLMPKFAGLSKLTRHKEWVRLALQEKMNREYGNKKISEREVQWYGDDHKEEINIIGSEIEKMLIDDMIEEVLYF